jgi:hypothetical protein
MTMFTTIVAYVCYFVLIVTVVHTMSFRRRMISICGVEKFRNCSRLSMFWGAHSERIVEQALWKNLLWLIGSFLIVRHFWIAGLRLESIRGSWLGALLFMVANVQIAFQSRPALVLFLGNSKPDQIRFQSALSDAAMPWRVVSLLDSSESLQSIARTAGNCFRLTLGRWEDAVHDFVQNALVVVLDLRDATEPVLTEFRFIKESGNAHKCIFLVSERSASTDLSESDLVLTSEEKCRHVLKMVLARVTQMPTPDRTLKEIVSSVGID